MGKQVTEMHRMRVEQFRPHVVVRIVPGRIIGIEVANIGMRRAEDVKLSFDPSLQAAWPESRATQSLALTRGLHALAPQEAHLFAWDKGELRHRAAGLPQHYSVDITYRDSENHKFEEKGDIDLEPLWQSTLARDPFEGLIDTVKGTNKELGAIVRALKETGEKR